MFFKRMYAEIRRITTTAIKNLHLKKNAVEISKINFDKQTNKRKELYCIGLDKSHFQ
jgi:hypothetical protein